MHLFHHFPYHLFKDPEHLKEVRVSAQMAEIDWRSNLFRAFHNTR